MNDSGMRLKASEQPKNKENNSNKVSSSRWQIKGINYSLGYAKLVHISTGEKRYVALLNFHGYHARFSCNLFLKADSAIERRCEIQKRLASFKAAAIVTGGDANV